MDVLCGLLVLILVELILEEIRRTENTQDDTTSPFLFGSSAVCGSFICVDREHGHIMFSTGAAVFLSPRKINKFTEDPDPKFTAQLSEWSVLFCTGVPGIVPGTGIDFTSSLSLCTFSIIHKC